MAVLQRGLAFEGVRCLFFRRGPGPETSFESKWLEKVDLNAFTVLQMKGLTYLKHKVPFVGFV